MVLENSEITVNEAKHECDPYAISDKEEAHVAVTINSKESSPNLTAEDLKKSQELPDKESVNLVARLSIFIFCIFALVIGRLGVPEEDYPNVKDRVVDSLQSVNDFINKPGNELYRDIMQMACSMLMDITFFVTFGYWVLRGKSVRLPISLGLFYVVRALVQQMWVSPFPQGYYWEAPLLPSLVVPYGRGSDFFFSGHSGFLVICASEWHKLKMPRVRNFVICVALYTIFILLAYRIHYSIDVFTGVIFAEWCFGKVDLHKENVGIFIRHNFRKLGRLFGSKYDQMMYVDQVLSRDSPTAMKV